MNATINQNSEAYNTGYEAAIQGESRQGCPYAAGTWDADNWFAGYDASGVELTEYEYSTDGESGTIEAVDFADACRQLDAMFTPDQLNDGAWGVVEDVDGEEYTVGSSR